MNNSTSKEDLFNPGAAGNFFQIEDLQPFEPQATASFSRRNALWLAEFSRLIYRQDLTEGKAVAGGSRAEILAKQRWTERFLPAKSVEAAIFQSETLGCAVLVFRGTLGLQDTFTDLQALMSDWEGDGKIHSGFKRDMESVWPGILPVLRELNGPLFITGHSLGAALATLAAAKIRIDRTLRSPAAVYSFGSPRVGDRTFADSLAGLFHCRVVNANDTVTTLPPAFSLPRFPVYQHTGTMHRLLGDGEMEVMPEGFDVADQRSPFKGVGDFMTNANGLLKGAFVSKGKISQPLMDHAPVNYVANLEKIPATQA